MKISSHKLKSYNEQQLAKYVARGKHHMRWQLNDAHRMTHSDLLIKLIEKYPETQPVMLNCLNKITSEIIANIIENLVKFKVPVSLSAERANFMLKLLQFRHQRLLSELEK